MLKEAAKPVVLRLQRYLRLFPKRICLISGAPRSGTTALVKWLGDQPGVVAFQESRMLVTVSAFMEEVYRFANSNRESATIVPLARQLMLDYYSSSRIWCGKRLIVEKEPLEPVAFPSRDYGHFLRNIKTLFPESKLLLAIRDPIATVWSMSARAWGESLTNKQTHRFTIEEYAQNWCSCADLILQYCSDRNTYIVQFGHLRNDSGNESRRILDFLEIREGKSFEPRQPTECGFSREKRESILRIAQPRLELLNSRGISDL